MGEPERQSDEALLSKVKVKVPRDDEVAQGVPSPTQSLRGEKEEIENQRRARLNDALDNYIKKTEDMYDTIRTMVWAWIIGLAVILVLQGWDCFSFEVPTPVLVTLAGTATANVIGLIVVVARHYFPAGGLPWLKDPHD